MIKGRILASIAVFFWGAAYIWGAIAMSWLSPLTATAARFCFAAIILLVIVSTTKSFNIKQFRGHWWHYFLLGFIGISCFQALLFFGVYLTSPINVAVIMALSPIVTAIAECAVSREIPSLRTVLALIISVIGATLAVLGAEGKIELSLSLNWGDLIAVLAALCFSFYTVASRRWLLKTVSPLANITIIMLIGAILILPLGLNSLPKILPSTTAPFWALLGLVIGSTVISYLCWTQAVEEIGVTEPNLLFNLMPVVTMLLSSLYGLPPTSEQVIGAILVIVGITWAMLQKKSSKIMMEPISRVRH